MIKRILLLAVSLVCLTGLLSALAEEEPLYYTIEVDLTNQITTVYHLSDHSIARQMICSSGLNEYTPLGIFRLEAPRPGTDRVDWYYISKYRCYVKYATRIKGPILFHSIPYAEKEMSSIDQVAVSQLGQKASHGCIRLRWEDAQWIAEHCPKGTVVNIYYGAIKKEALRKTLLANGYTAESSMSYDEFLGTTPTDGRAFSIGRGATGATVTALQRRLTELGLLSEGDATGRYDGATVVAVMRCQANYDVEVNGVVSRGLMKLLDINVPEGSERVMEEEPSSEVTPQETPEPVPLLPIPAQTTSLNAEPSGTSQS